MAELGDFVLSLSDQQQKAFKSLVAQESISIGSQRHVRTPAQIAKEAVLLLDYEMAIGKFVRG